MSSGARDRPCPLISSSACSLSSSKVAMSEQCSIELVLLPPRPPGDGRATPTSALSARLKPLRAKSSVASSWGGGCESNRFKLDAGMKIIRIVTVSQHFSKVLQRHCIRQINQCSNIGFGFSPRLSPDPKRGEQSRSMVNEVLVDRTVDAPSDLALLHPSGETRSSR
jgi:hypothetical protein